MDLPVDVYLLALLPPPAWPRYMAPGHDEGQQADARDLDTTGVLIDCFSFLGDLGFDLAPASAWEREAFTAIPFTRADGAVLPLLTGHLDLAVVISGPLERSISAQAVLQQDGATVAFGSFPLAPPNSEILHTEVQLLAAAFAEAVKDQVTGSPMSVEEIAVAGMKLASEMRRERWANHLRDRGEAAWREGRLKQLISELEGLEHIDALSAVEQTRLGEARANAVTQNPALSREGLKLRQWYERCAELVNSTDSALNESVEHREESDLAFAAWEDAALAHREAVDAMYPERLWSNDALRQGDPAAIEEALTFLEVDPRTFHSGYMKRHLTSMLSRLRLAEPDRARARAICLHVVDAGDRPEFHAYSRLARPNATRPFRRALHERLRERESGVARRALWMLGAIGRSQFDAAEIDRARQLIFSRAIQAGDELGSGWVEKYSRRFWSADWQAELIDLAIGDDATRGAGAMVVLSHAGIRTPLEPRPADGLTRKLLQMVDGDAPGSVYEWLATQLDTPELREELRSRTKSTDSDVRRRSTWALNSIIRHQGGG